MPFKIESVKLKRMFIFYFSLTLTGKRIGSAVEVSSDQPSSVRCDMLIRTKSGVRPVHNVDAH